MVRRDDGRGRRRRGARDARMSRVRQRRRGAQGDGRRALRLECGVAGRGATSTAPRPSCAPVRWQQPGTEEGGSDSPGCGPAGREGAGGGGRAGRAEGEWGGGERREKGSKYGGATVSAGASH